MILQIIWKYCCFEKSQIGAKKNVWQQYFNGGC